MSKGFIPVKRSLFEHFLFKERRTFSRFEAWLDLIQMASFTDENRELINGKLVSRDRGEVVASLRYLAQRWTWSVSKVSDYLELLRSQQMAVATKESGMTKIRLLNFEKHNSMGGEDSENNGKDRKKNSKSRNRIGFDQNKETATSTQNDTAREQQGNSEETNNNKDNKGNNENDSVAGATSFTQEQLQLYALFDDWIEKNAPKVNQMKEPITIKQYFKLREDYPGPAGRELIQEVILAMHNRKTLLKDYESANLTLRSWINMRKKNGTVNLNNNGTAPNSINEKLKAAGSSQGATGS